MSLRVNKTKNKKQKTSNLSYILPIKKAKLLVVFLCIPLVAISIMWRVHGARAEATTFKLRILPQDCIFTVADAGTQTLLFLTPSVCEPPPPPDNGDGNTGGSTGNQGGPKDIINQIINDAPKDIKGQGSAGNVSIVLDSFTKASQSLASLRQIIFENSKSYLIALVLIATVLSSAKLMGNYMEMQERHSRRNYAYARVRTSNRRQSNRR